MTTALLWEVLAEAGSKEAIAASLSRLPDAELRALCLEYFQARADLVFAIQETGRADGASEDVLDDLAEAVLRLGQAAYQAALEELGPLPDRAIWSRLEVDALRGVIMGAWEARFDDDLFDALENA